MRGMPPIGSKRVVLELSPDPNMNRNEYEWPGVCPGFMGRGVAIAQAAEACVSLEKGELSTYYPRKPNAILEGALFMDSARASYSSWRLKKKD